MRKLYYIAALCILAASAVQAQKISFREMFDPKQPLTRSAGTSNETELRLDPTLIQGKPDSTVRVDADQKLLRKQEFSYDAKGRMTTNAFLAAGTITRWNKQDRTDYVYADDNTVKEETELLGINNEWVNDQRYIYGKGEEAYEKSKWEKGQWQPDSKVEYLFDKDGLATSKSYYFYQDGAYILKSRVDYTYDPARQLLTETLFMLSESKDAPGKLEKNGTYTYVYDQKTGKQAALTYAPAGQQISWKEEYTYQGERTTNTTLELKNGQWAQTEIRTAQKDEQGRILYFQAYNVKEGVKTGTSYYERTFDPNGEEKSSMTYEWDPAANDWRNKKKLISTLNDEGRILIATTTFWKNEAWENNKQLKAFYNEDGFLARMQGFGWSAFYDKFISGDLLKIYYKGVSTANESITPDRKTPPFRINGRTITLLPDAIAPMSVFGILGEVKSWNTFHYTVPVAGCYVISIAGQSFKVMIH